MKSINALLFFLFLNLPMASCSGPGAAGRSAAAPPEANGERAPGGPVENAWVDKDLEPSGVVWCEALSCFVMVSDEEDWSPVTTFRLGDLRRLLKDNSKPIAPTDLLKEAPDDLEGIAIDGTRVAITGSLGGRGVGGKACTSQLWLFDLVKSNGNVEATNVRKYTDFRRRLIQAVGGSDPILKDSVGRSSKHGGLNVEGLAFHGDNLLFALRGPVDEQRGTARIYEVSCPDSEGKIKLVKIHEVRDPKVPGADSTPRGFRGIEPDPAEDGWFHVLMGAESNARDRLVLARWKYGANKVESAEELGSKFVAEGITAFGDQRELLIVSDKYNRLEVK